MRYRTIVLVLLAVILSSILPIYAQQDDSIDEQEARAIALALYPNASVMVVESVVENGVQAWDVKLSNGLAVYIHATTGAIIEIESWDVNTAPDIQMNVADLPPPVANPNPVNIGTDGVNFFEAQQIALSYYPNALVVKAELTDEDTIRAWDVHLNNGVAVYIHVQTGAVIEFEGWVRQINRNPHNRPSWAGFAGLPHIGQVPTNIPNTPALNNQTPTQATISLEQALAIVQELYPNATLEEAELTRDDYNTLAWDIVLDNGMSVYVHAITGEILEIERED